MNIPIFGLFSCMVGLALAGISPVHDLKAKLSGSNNAINGQIALSSPHRVLQHLDDKVSKATKNITENNHLEKILNEISKDLVSTIITKLEIQDKITRITKEALDASGKSKGITAIETRRILDFISKTLSGNVLSITKKSTEPELHRLVYGLAQIAAEVSIVSALDDITYTSALSKKQAVDMTVRRKREVSVPVSNVSTANVLNPRVPPMFKPNYNKTSQTNNFAPPPPPPNKNDKFSVSTNNIYAVFTKNDKIPMSGIKNTNIQKDEVPKSFLNQTSLDEENNRRLNDDKTDNKTQNIMLNQPINVTDFVTSDTQPEDLHRDDSEDIYEDQVQNLSQGDIEEKNKIKMEKLESKAKKAILYAGDVAYLTAASVVAMRRALTAATEVKMSVKLANSGMAHHQELMMNLARTAAQQAGKEAKSATSKSLACDRVLKMALKYTSQSRGAKLNHIANRIVMDTVSLATLAKSMAFVSSDIAINSLYEATEIKTMAPSTDV